MTDDFAADCLKERGRPLTGEFAHYCYDWDGLTVDETTDEFASCGCFDDSCVFKFSDFTPEQYARARELKEARL